MKNYTLKRTKLRERSSESPYEATSQTNLGMVRRALYAVATAFLAGAIGYVFTVANELRKANLEFVNNQIEKMYGPLNAAAQGNDAVWKLFLPRHIQRETISTIGSAKEICDKAKDIIEWRHWVKTVFQPINKEMKSTIVSNSHLLIGDTLPCIFSIFIAHTEAYDAVTKAWKEDDFQGCSAGARQDRDPGSTNEWNTALGLDYPSKILDCIREDYQQLKRLQVRLRSVWSVFPSTMVTSSACIRQGLVSEKLAQSFCSYQQRFADKHSPFFPM